MKQPAKTIKVNGTLYRLAADYSSLDEYSQSLTPLRVKTENLLTLHANQLVDGAEGLGWRILSWDDLRDELLNEMRKIMDKHLSA